MKSNLDSDFIVRTLRTTAILLLIFVPFGLYYFGVYPTIAILSGAIWSFLNLMFLTALVKAAIRAGGPDGVSSAAWAFVKFPLLYAAGYFLLKVPVFDPVYLLIGFSSLMAVMLLKVLGRVFLGLDNSNAESQSEKLSRVH